MPMHRVHGLWVAFGTDTHDDRFFEKIAQSNVPAADRDPGDQVIPFWT